MRFSFSLSLSLGMFPFSLCRCIVVVYPLLTRRHHTISLPYQHAFHDVSFTLTRFFYFFLWMSEQNAMTFMS